MRICGGLAGVLGTIVLTVTSACSPSTVTAGVVRTEAIVTTADRRQLLAPLAVAPTTVAPRTVSQDTASMPGVVRLQVDTAVRGQVMDGFGAALTDASVLLLSALPRAMRDSLLQELFTPITGAGFSMLRVPLGASDFSVAHGTFEDERTERGASGQRVFDVAGETPRLALLREIERLQPDLLVMGTPWSAPAWMKQPATLYGGTLRPDMMDEYARYLVRIVQSFDSAGAPLDLLSVQNEPAHEPADYPGMRLSAAQRATLVGQHLGPALAALPRAPRLLEWDHNWDAPREPLTVLRDSTARSHLYGVAWHCYAGDVSAQGVVHDAFPALATYFTECAGGAWAPDFGDNLLWNARTLVVGATRQWARGVMLWNLALDVRGGPHLGGCADCRGVITVDTLAHTATRNEEYYALVHAARFVRRGAVRVASRMTAGESSVPKGARANGSVRADSAGVSHVAFVNPDRSVVLIIVNERNIAQPLLLPHGRVLLPARSVVTVVERPA